MTKCEPCLWFGDAGHDNITYGATCRKCVTIFLGEMICMPSYFVLRIKNARLVFISYIFLISYFLYCTYYNTILSSPCCYLFMSRFMLQDEYMINSCIIYSNFNQTQGRKYYNSSASTASLRSYGRSTCIFGACVSNYDPHSSVGCNYLPMPYIPGSGTGVHMIIEYIHSDVWFLCAFQGTIVRKTWDQIDWRATSQVLDI